MRHAHRYPIVDVESTYTTPLTPEGVKLAEQFGARLNQAFQPGRLLASPVGRCQSTGEAIARGAAWNLPVRTDNRLSHPHIQPAIAAFSAWTRDKPLPTQVQEVLDLVLEGTHSEPALDLMITHDTVIACLVSYLLGASVSNEFWPDYLEGLFIWPVDGSLQTIWRGQIYPLPDLSYQPGLFWKTA
jgi:broad specificity phosphatase PhoE